MNGLVSTDKGSDLLRLAGRPKRYTRICFLGEWSGRNGQAELHRCPVHSVGPESGIHSGYFRLTVNSLERRTRKVIFFSWTVGVQNGPRIWLFRELSGRIWRTEIHPVRSVRRPRRTMEVVYFDWPEHGLELVFGFSRIVRADLADRIASSPVCSSA